MVVKGGGVRGSGGIFESILLEGGDGVIGEVDG